MLNLCSPSSISGKEWPVVSKIVIETGKIYNIVWKDQKTSMAEYTAVIYKVWEDIPQEMVGVIN